MIERYSLPEMKAVWSEEQKVANWKEIEALVAEAWAEEGVASATAASAIREASLDLSAWKEREGVTRHDLAAFVDVLADSVGEGAEWVHYGLTSSDVLDTANAVAMRDAADLLLRRLGELFAAVKGRAFEFQDTAMVGRTHGAWSEPITFGLKLATWAFELARDYERLLDARATVAFGKISGSVGTYAHTPPAIEAFVCDRLGLQPEPASSQVTPRDRHATFLTTLAVIGSSLERFAVEIRNLARSEISEVREPFAEEQKGSSSMPHKRNPILSENVTGLSRLLRAYASAALEDVALWHERDISHSSVERVVLPDACGVLDFALVRMREVVEGLVVDGERMQANLEATNGLIYSQAVLLALVDKGHSRDEAFRLVQRNALTAWEEGRQLQDLLAADPEIDLTDGELKECFSTTRFLRNTDVVFARLQALQL